MYCILSVGMTGQGKSKFVKDYISGKRCYVFDVQNEYSDLAVNPIADRGRLITLDEKQFVLHCTGKKNTVCVFEEATGFFEGKLDKTVRRLVLSKRHSGNYFIFCFHSISSIPPRLMQLTNYVVLFKTGDEPYQVEQKFPSLLSHYMQLKKLPNHSSLTIQTIPQ
ncbi:MAG TPA: hypothetical protein VF487_13240 [Chitinophagaceae bacterium]